MPTNAPKVKRAATEGYGARVVEYDPEKTTRREVAEQLASEEDFTLKVNLEHRPAHFTSQATDLTQSHGSQNFEQLVAPGSHQVNDALRAPTGVGLQILDRARVAHVGPQGTT